MLKQGSQGEAPVSLPPSQALRLSVGVCEGVGPPDHPDRSVFQPAHQPEPQYREIAGGAQGACPPSPPTLPPQPRLPGSDGHPP